MNNFLRYKINVILDGHIMCKNEKESLELLNFEKNIKTLKKFFNPEHYLYKTKKALSISKYLDEIESEKNITKLEELLIQTIYSIPKNKFNKYYNFKISLKDLYQGFVSILEKCKECQGTGKIIQKECKKCLGNKQLNFEIYNRFNMVHKNVECDDCEGEGLIGLGTDCKICNGKKEYKKIIENIIVPIDKNQIIINKINLHFNTSYAEGKIIKKNLDIIYTKEISLYQLIYGFSFNISLFEIKNLKIESTKDKVYQPNKLYMIPNLGFKNGDMFGNLFIKFEIIYPSTLEEFEKGRYIENEDISEGKYEKFKI